MDRPVARFLPDGRRLHWLDSEHARGWLLPADAGAPSPEAFADVFAAATAAWDLRSNALRPDGWLLGGGTSAATGGSNGDQSQTNAQAQGVPVSSDGYNWRLANLTGCMVGASVTTAGSGLTNGIYPAGTGLGTAASPTCVMSYGDGGGATGWMIGPENGGIPFSGLGTTPGGGPTGNGRAISSRILLKSRSRFADLSSFESCSASVSAPT